MYTIWGRPNCKWCDEAKKLLTYNFIDYEYIELNPDNSDTFARLTNGAKTVPQIFSPSGELIGGYENLVNYLVPKAVD